MADMNRRQFVRVSGAGAGLAFGAGAGSGQQRGRADPAPESDFPVGFTAPVENGQIVVDGDNPSDSDATLNLNLQQLDGNINIEGEIYEDKTWASNDIQFPPINPGELIDAEDIDGISSLSFDDSTNIEVIVDTIEGTYDPDQPLVIGNIDMLIDAEVYGTATVEVTGSEVDFSFIFELDINNGQDIELTTEQSGTLEGEASGLATENPTAVVVNNDHTVPEATGEKLEECVGLGICLNINEELGLPSNNPLRNFIQLALEPNWNDEPPQFGLPSLPGYDGPPQDLDEDGLYEDITGDGSADVFDTQALFENLDSDIVQDNAGAFNFNEFSPDDEVTILDVASHWKQNAF